MNRISKITLTLAIALIAMNCYSIESKAAEQNPVKSASTTVLNVLQNATQMYKDSATGKNKLNGGRTVYETHEARYGTQDKAGRDGIGNKSYNNYNYDSDTLFAKARSAESSGKNKEAFGYYEALNQKYPNNLKVLEAYGNFAQRNGYYIKAIELNKKLYSLTKNQKYNLKAADLMVAQGNINGAASIYRQIYGSGPQFQSKMIALNYKYGRFKSVVPYCRSASRYSSYNQLLCGKSFFYTGNKAAAKGLIENYVKRNPSSQEGKKILADIYLATKDYNKAAELLSKQAYSKSAKLKLAGLYMAGKQFDKASAVYQSVLNSDPKDLQVMQSLLDSYLAQKKVKPAAQVAEKILSLNPSNEKVKELLGDLYMAQNQFDKANALFSKAVKAKPSDIDFLQSLADSDLALNNFKEAATVLERLAKLEPNNIKIKRKLAESYFGIQEYEKANQIFGELLKASPNNTEILTFLVDGNTSLKNFSQAADYQMKIMTLKQAKLTEAESKLLNIKLGNLYLADNNFKSAEGVFSKLSLTYPDDFDILMPLSDIYLSDKRYPEAINILAQAIKLKPEDNALKLKLAKAYIAMNEFTEAKVFLEDLAKVQPEDTEVLSFLADSYLALSDYDNAVTTLNKLSTIKPGDRDIQEKLGNAYLIGCRFEEAKNLFLALNRDYPDDPDIIKALSDCHLALGEYQAAIDLLTPMMQKESNNVDLIIKFSNALLALNRFEDARQILERTKAVYPDNNDIKELLGSSYLYLGDFQTALNYFNSIPEDKRNDRITYDRAECFRLMKDYTQAESIYNQLKNSPAYLERACVGIGYSRIGQNKFFESRDIFNAVLRTNSGNQEAKLGLAITYLSTEDYFHALEILNALPVNDKDNYYKAIAYYKMKMFDDAYALVQNNTYQEAKDLNRAIVGNLQIDFQPLFQLHRENGDVNNSLNFERYGFEVSKYIKYNMKLKAGFSMTPYHTEDNSVTATEYRLGLEGRPFKKLGINSDIGIKTFSNDGLLVLGKALVDYYATDKLRLSAGYWRYNIEESLLSAAGLRPEVGTFAGRLVGRAVDNKYLMGYNYRLPHYFYNYGGFNLGYVTEESLPSNFYKEANLGLGKVLLTRPDGALLDLAMGEYNIYYAGYNDNRLGFNRANLLLSPLGSGGGSTAHTGGYFSPSDFIIANKFALHLRGKVNPLRARYYVCGYLGTQSISGSNDDGTSMIWGSSVGVRINDEGRLGLGLLYQIDSFDVARRQDFIVNLLLRI